MAQTAAKKAFATNDKILHPDGDFFAIPRIAQQLVVGPPFGRSPKGAGRFTRQFEAPV